MSRSAAIPIVSAAALFAVGCHRADAVSSTAPEAGPATAPAAVVASRLSEPERIQFAPQIMATGSLKAQQQAQLSFAVPGTLQRISAKRGQLVTEGAVLASLDSDLARAAVTQAEAGLVATRAQLRVAEDSLTRLTAIRKEDGIPESQLVQAQSQRDVVAAQVLVAQAQVEQARVTLSHHLLRAPFAGVVTKVPDGIGASVSPGIPLFTLESTKTLTLETTLTQEEAAGVRAGMKVTVVVPATGARSDEASVRMIVPSVDTATNRVPLEVMVPNSTGRFLPNAFARAQFPSGAPREALRVPASTLTQREGSFSVWIVEANGRARALAVRLLEQQAETAVVTAEAWPTGARLIETPPLGIADGMLIADGSGR